jgi:hypothetical protein
MKKKDKRVGRGKLTLPCPTRGKRKLKGQHRWDICVMLAMGYTAPLIVQELREKYGIEISQMNIYHNYLQTARYKKIIAEIRRRSIERAAQHPLYSKYTRLEILLTAINYALRYSTDKLYFDKDGVLVGKTEKNNLSVISGLIEQARVEVEGLNKEIPALKLNLVNIIKEVSDNEGNRVGYNFRTEGNLGPDGAPKTDNLDQQGPGDYEVL